MLLMGGRPESLRLELLVTVKLINTGLGNIVSVQNWLNSVGISYSIISEDRDDANFEDQILILPGVANSINYLHNLQSFKNLFDQIQTKKFKKIIGICAGFQVLCQQVEENGKNEDGINLIPATSSDARMVLYNNGWGKTSFSKMFQDIKNERKNVYFNHSCGVFPQTDYGAFDLDSRGFAISYSSEKILGLQFHPEKSGAFGIKLGKYIFDV